MKSRTLVLSLAAGLLVPSAALLSGCANKGESRPVARGEGATAPTETGPMGPGMQQGWVPGGIATVALRSGEQFIREAGMSNMAEIQMSEVALEQASDEDVRQFAQHMINDHTRLLENLSRVARTQNVGMPMSVSMADRQTIERLSQFQGDRFDREYIQEQIVAHERAIALHEQQARDGSNPDLQAEAQAALPVLRDHLRMAQQIQSRIQGAPTGASGQGMTPAQSIPVRQEFPQQQPSQQGPRDFVSPEPSTPPGQPR